MGRFLKIVEHSWPSLLRSPWFFAVVVPLLWALAMLPELGARDLRLEEGRRATPALEMVRSGDYVTPTLYGQPYVNKPPLFFYLVAGVAKVQAWGGGKLDEWSVRLPSVVSVLVGAWLLWGFSLGTLSRETRALAALVFMSVPMVLDKGTLGEIDACLSLLAFGALVCWWNGYDAERQRISLAGWIGAGVCLGLAAWMKGPGGPIEFYVVVVAYCLVSPQGARGWGGGGSRFRPLVSVGHLVMIVLMVVPVGCWVLAMMRQTGMSAHELAALWSNQMHLNAAEDVQWGGAGWRGMVVDHYLPFVFQVFAVLLPWSIPAALASFPRVMQSGEAVRPTWRLLACAGPALVLFFWLWPMSNARYLMMICYPVAVLAAVGIRATREHAWPPSALRFCATAAQVMPVVVLVMALGAVVVETLVWRDSFGTTLVVGGVSAVLSLIGMGLARRTSLAEAPVAAACAGAVLMLLGRGLAASVVLPHVAKRDSARIVHEQIEALVPATRPVYTALTFQGGRGEDYYNPQFYLPGPVRGVDDFHLLPLNERVTVILHPDQWAALQAVVPDARKVGVLSAPKGPPAVWVVEAERHGAAR